MLNDNLSKKLVLYADDDPDDLSLVSEAFTQYSGAVEVLTFSDGVELLSYLKVQEKLEPAPCLIILDINMPRLNGKDTLRNLRLMQQFTETPVILFTTSSMSLDKNFAEKYNAGFITKPIDDRQMERIADEFLQHCSEEVRRGFTD